MIDRFKLHSAGRPPPPEEVCAVNCLLDPIDLALKDDNSINVYMYT